MQTIGDRIRSKRITHKMSMQVLADALGKSKGNISEYEKGKYEPSAQTVIALSRIFQVSTDWLLTGEAYFSQDSDSSTLFMLSKRESDLMSMFRMLDERDKVDAYDNIYCKYKRAHKDPLLHRPYDGDGIAEETTGDSGKPDDRNN